MTDARKGNQRKDRSKKMMGVLARRGRERWMLVDDGASGLSTSYEKGGNLARTWKQVSVIG